MADLAGVLKELEQERARLDQVIQVIGNLVGRNGTGIRIKTRRSKRTLSAAARKKISLAQKARWAKVRAGNVVSIASKRGKSTISAAGRKRIAAAQRARWAKLKAGKKAA